MQYATKKWVFILLGCLLSFHASAILAERSLWTSLQNKQTQTSSAVQQRLLHLDEAYLKQLLSNPATPVTLALPFPDGRYETVRLEPNSVLAPHIAALHPELRTWRIQGLTDTVVSGRAELTHLGFHAMLTLRNGDTLYINPQQATTQAAERTYRSLSRHANPFLFQRDYSCQTQSPERPSFAQTNQINYSGRRAVAAKAGEALHTYRLAIAATGEYTQYFGSKEAALSAVVSTVNRVNEIYERDLAIRFELVSGTETLFDNPDTDNYSTSSTQLALINNQVVLDSLIGADNYDIGHLFSLGFGGIARVESACSRLKAQGLSGWQDPAGEVFAVDFVAHELGHQLGGLHTFNSTTGSCQTSRTDEVAYEPGSGSTIMAYAGICTGNNLQVNSDPMFHAGSIAQITGFAHGGEGASCAAVSGLNNSNPEVDAGRDYTIPARTPFILTGTASDSDEDELSYAWDQMDAGTASSVDVDAGDNALIRSLMPASSPERLIPRWSDLTSNSHTVGESLPISTRALNFRLQVRDGKGGIGHDDKRINVKDTGEAFAVTAPNGTSLQAGEELAVKWTVADTDIAPINCKTVDIALDKHSNNTFESLLAKATKNDGEATITLPDTLGDENRIRVKCSDNIFFALSASSPKQAKTEDDVDNTTATDEEANDSGGGGFFPSSLLLLLAGLTLGRQQQRGKLT